MAPAHWLVELEVEGRRYRWAASRQSVATNDGDTLVYWPGLVAEPSAAVGDEVSIQVYDPEHDWTSRPAALDRAPSLLLRWEEGTTYEQATVYSRGLAMGASYGRRGRLSWDIKEDQLQLGLQMPDPQAQATGQTWPVDTPGYSLPDDQKGVFYPIIFGMPGFVAGANSPQRVVPAPMVQFKAATFPTSYLAVNHEPLPSAVTQVFVENVNAGVTGWEDVSNVEDALGRTISVCDFVNDTSLLPGAAGDRKSLYVGFHETGGGGAAYRGAHEVIDYVLRTWGNNTGVDWGRMANLEWLDGYKVDTFVNASTRPWEWLEATLVRDLPIVVRHSTTGRYLERDRYWATSREALGTLDYDRGDWEERSDIKWVDTEVINEISVEFRKSRSGAWLSRKILTAETTQVGRVAGSTLDERVLADPRCRLSQSRYGLRSGDPIGITWTWDENTALLVAEHYADKQALPHREVAAWVRDGADLRTGDVYLLTHADLGLSDTVAIVKEPPIVTRAGATVTFRLPWSTT